jgi:hypothetical protein
MIRRIVLFLWVLFVWFFLYHRYDKIAANNMLYKIKNFSFSKNDTTIIYEKNWSESFFKSDLTWGLWEKFSDTLSDKKKQTSNNIQIIEQILNKDNLEKGVVVWWISGKVIIQTWYIETISAQPLIKKHISTKKTDTEATLSEEDKKEAEAFAQIFSN